MEDRVRFWESLKNMFLGVAHPELYMKNGKKGSMGPAVFALFVMCVVLYFLICFLPYNKLYGNGRLADNVESVADNFELFKTGFVSDKLYEWSDKQNLQYICIDTSVSEVGQDEAQALVDENGYLSVLIISRKEILSYSDGAYQILLWSDIYGALSSATEIGAISKQNVVDFIRQIDTPVLVSLYVICAVARFVWTFLVLCVIGLVGLIVSSVLHVKNSFGELYKAAAYIYIPWFFVLKLLATYVISSRQMMNMLIFVTVSIYMLLAVVRYSKLPEEKNENQSIGYMDGYSYGVTYEDGQSGEYHDDNRN